MVSIDGPSQILWRQTECVHLQDKHEAERELASLSKANKIWAALTEDGNIFAFGAKRVIRP